MLGLALGGAATLSLPAAAQSAPQQAASYHIAAGSLDQALKQFAKASGVLLAYTPEMVQDKQSAGLNGNYTTQAAFNALLAGSGLEAKVGTNGQYTLQRAVLTPAPIAVAPASAPTSRAEATLPTTVVRGSAQLDATTEDINSYAARAATVAGKTPMLLKQTPASVSVLTRERMQDQNLTTLQEALRYVTGVESIDYGDNTAYFRSRGSQLGVQFDGVPIASGLQYQSQFDLAMYDRVEVMRGPAAVMSGIGEPGGSVNLVRKRPKEDFHVQTETQASTFGGLRQMVDVTGPLNEAGTVRGRAVVVGANTGVSVDRTRNREFMAYGALDIDLMSGTKLELSATHEVSTTHGIDYGAGGVINSSRTALIGRVPSSYTRNFSPDWGQSYTSVQEASANLTHKFDNGWQSSSTLYYRGQGLRSWYAYSGAGATANSLAYFGNQRQRAGYNWFGADTHVSGPVEAFGRTHTVTVGADYSRMGNSSRYGYKSVAGPMPGGTWDLNDPNAVPKVDTPFTSGTTSRLEQYGLYAQARVRVADPLTVVLGAREAFLHQRSQDFIPTQQPWRDEAKVDHRFLPSVGVVWDINPSTTAYVSYARFLAAQTETTFAGAMLAPRTGTQYEVGVKNSFLQDRLSTTMALFYLEDNGRAVSDPNNPRGSVPAGRARNQGVELEVSGKPTNNWNLYAGYTYLDIHFDNDGANLTDGTDPRNLFKLWTNYRFTEGALKGWNIGGGMVAQSSISRGVTQGGYAVYNAQIGYQVNRHVNVALQINNLFDRDYYLRPPGRFFSVFGDKRNAMLTVRTDF